MPAFTLRCRPTHYARHYARDPHVHGLRWNIQPEYKPGNGQIESPSSPNQKGSYDFHVEISCDRWCEAHISWLRATMITYETPRVTMMHHVDVGTQYGDVYLTQKFVISNVPVEDRSVDTEFDLLIEYDVNLIVTPTHHSDSDE